jgi:hypothetical protein
MRGIKPVPHLPRVLLRSAGQGRPAKVSSSFSLTQRCAQRPCYRFYYGRPRALSGFLVVKAAPETLTTKKPDNAAVDAALAGIDVQMCHHRGERHTVACIRVVRGAPRQNTGSSVTNSGR